MSGSGAGRPRRLAVDKSKMAVAIVLFAFAAITAFDASQMTFRVAYGLNPNTASYLVAGFLALLAFAHVWLAFQPNGDGPELEVDWEAIVTMVVGLASLVLCIFLGAGFVTGSTLLFAITARAFNRRAIFVDLLIGFVLSVGVFLLFNNLLRLALPSGPLERLF